ncbi:hypothetical protein Tco_1564785 [Tanacetum coccineum]
METRLAVEAPRLFEASPSFMFCKARWVLNLSMISANLTKDSSRVGGLDGLDDGGGVYEGWSWRKLYHYLCGGMMRVIGGLIIGLGSNDGVNECGGLGTDGNKVGSRGAEAF